MSTPTSAGACSTPASRGWRSEDEAEGQLAARCPGLRHLKQSRRRKRSERSEGDNCSGREAQFGFERRTAASRGATCSPASFALAYGSKLHSWFKHAVLATLVASDNDFGCSRLTSFFSSKLESPSTNSVTLVSSSNAGTRRLLPANRVMYSSRFPDCRVLIRRVRCHSSASFSANAFVSWDLNSNQSLGRRLPSGPQLEISHFLALPSKKEATYPTGSAGCNVRRASCTENSHSAKSSVRPPKLSWRLFAALAFRIA